MNVGLTIPAMSIKVPAPGMPKIKVNADIRMPPKQSLKSMLPKFRYNIPTFVDDHYPPYSPPMEYAASSSSNQQSIAPLQSNSNRPRQRGNPKNQFKAAAANVDEQRFNRRPSDRPFGRQTFAQRPSSSEPNGHRLNDQRLNDQRNDRRKNGNRQQAHANHRPLAANSFQQPAAFGESRLRKNSANFEPIRHRPSGHVAGREMRPRSSRN